MNPVADIIGVEPHVLEGCNKNKMLLYLIHANNPEKTQYDVNEVQGELKGLLAERLFKEEEEEEHVANILEFIEKTRCTKPVDLMKYAIESKQVKYLRQNQLMYSKIMEQVAKENYEEKERERKETKQLQLELTTKKE